MSAEGLYTRDQMVAAYRAGNTAAAAGMDESMAVRWVDAQDPVKLIPPLDGRSILVLSETFPQQAVMDMMDRMVRAAKAEARKHHLDIEGRADLYLPMVLVAPAGATLDGVMAHFEEELREHGWRRVDPER